MSDRLLKGKLLQLRVQGIGSRGEGLAREGEIEIFIPKTLRGDLVEAKLLESKKGRWRAEPLRLIEKGDERREARCRHFEICGGCDFQHLPYQEQIDWKLRMTKHWIRRSSLAPLQDKIEFELIPSPDEFHYRRRVRLQVKDGKIHFFRPHSKELFQLQECPILKEGFFEALEDEAKKLPDTPDWNESFVDGKLAGNDKTFYEIENCRIYFDRNSFVQANEKVNESIWNRIREETEGLPSRKQALDLFCGVGNFSLPLARNFESVVGVELEAALIDQARENARTNSLSNTEFIAAEVEGALKDFEKKRNYFDFILLDPPRAGAFGALPYLAQLYSPKIVYVSCQLESLIRDLVFLTKKGGYKIERWAVADMFPQTHHIESVVTLIRS